MSRIQVGYQVKELKLPGINHRQFDLSNLQGKRYLLSFHRFAACPFCNLHIHELVTKYAQLGESFEIVAIFDSPLDNLQRHTEGHHAPFPILADTENIYYKQFAVERSLWGTLKGAVIRFPAMLYAMLVKGYLPVSFKGNVTTMPLDLLVDEQGVVQVVHYGKDEGDHLNFESIKTFALSEF